LGVEGVDEVLELSAGFEPPDSDLDVVLSDFAVDEPEDDSLLTVGLVDPYRSEYQPPPFKMKPPLREIWRWASA
jgi:hypothetical protein